MALNFQQFQRDAFPKELRRRCVFEEFAEEIKVISCAGQDTRDSYLDKIVLFIFNSFEVIVTCPCLCDRIALRKAIRAVGGWTRGFRHCCRVGGGIAGSAVA